MARKLVIVFTIVVLLSTFASINPVSAYPYTIGTYDYDDYTMGDAKTHFALNEDVYIQWDAPDLSLEWAEVIVYSPTGTTHYHRDTTGMFAYPELVITASDAGTWTVEIKEYGNYYVLATCTFTVGTLVVTPENNYGSLIAIAGCFTAVAAFGAIKRKGNKFTNNFHP